MAQTGNHKGLTFGIFLAPFHRVGENPTLGMARDMELIEWIDELGYEATFQRRQDQSVGSIASGAGAKTVTFDKPFFVGTASLGGVNSSLPSVGITAQNMAAGDYFTIGSVAGNEFVVTFRNSGGTAIDRNFTWSVVGYGKGT